MATCRSPVTHYVSVIPLVTLITWLGMTACARRETRMIAPPVATLAAFSATGETVMPARWWSAFEDARLTAAIDEILAANLDLRIARARLEQSLALAERAGAPLLPQASGSGSVTRARNTARPEHSQYYESYDAAFTTSYEIDLWNRLRSGRDAASMNALASAENAATLATTITARAADLWFSIIEAKERRDLLKEQVRVNETYLELVTLRFGQGLVSSVDVHQQRQQLAATRSQIPPLEARLAVLRHELAVLAGRPPTASDFEPEGRLPEPPPMPRTGPPAELLEKRPDVRAARNLVIAADHQLAAARAQRLPSISLTGRLVFSNTLSANLFNDWIGSLIAGLTQPLFDGGRINAEIKQARSAAAERLADYGKVVLAAYAEVEDALANERGQTEQLAELERRIAIARATLAQSRERYANGLTEYLPVLTALQTLQSLEVARLTARRDLLSQRIRLYKALGGAWRRDLVGHSAEFKETTL